MMLHIMFMAEVISAMICLHSINGKKFKFNVETVMLIITVVLILEGVNYFGLRGIFSTIGYILIIIYCIYEFKISIFESIISFVLCMIILTTSQFVFMFISNLICERSVEIRNVLSNIMTLVVFYKILPMCKLDKLKECICKKRKQLLLLCFVSLVVVAILAQSKIIYEVDMRYFVFVVPAILLIFYFIIKWYNVQEELEQKKDAICQLGRNSMQYEELLTNIRMRQHEFKNHMTAIFSAHYTHKTYEKLVNVQEQYCNQLLCENKYNNLVFLGNNVLVGYLYGKFQEAEIKGIQVKYDINTRVDDIRIPTYHIVEMLGILFDNAEESLIEDCDRTIYFMVEREQGKYEFSFMNPWPYVSYDEISNWFMMDKSGKGVGRGVGLYHLKYLCDKWNCEIECKNIERQHQNWIKIILKI